MTPEPALLLLAHGSRDPAWAQPFERLREQLERRLPDAPIALAFLEHMKPSLAEAIATLAGRGAERITLLPLLMAQGTHLRLELPRLIARACEDNPGVLVRTTEAVGEVERVLAAITDWALDEHERTRVADLGHPLA